MRLSTRAQACHRSGLVVDGVRLLDLHLPEWAGGAEWLDDDTLIYAQQATVETYHVPTGLRTTVDQGGMQVLRAGGGRWQAWNGGHPSRCFGTLGELGRGATVLGCSRDGTIAIQRAPWDMPTPDAPGWTLYAPDGRQTFIPFQGVSDFVVLGPTAAMWAQAGRIQTFGVLPPVCLLGAGWLACAEVGSEAWVIYWTEPTGLVAHPWDSLRGYLVAPPGTFTYNLDAIGLADGRLRLVWSDGPGELPSDYRVQDLDLSAPRLDWGAWKPPPPPPEIPHVEPFPRPLWLAAFWDKNDQFGDTPGLPINMSMPGGLHATARCELPVIVSGDLLPAVQTPIVALYCQTPEEIPALRALAPGRDVLMVWDGPVPDLPLDSGADIIGLELYSDKTLREPAESIASRVRNCMAGIPAAQRLALVPQAFDHGGNYVLDWVGIIKEAIAIAREFPNVVAILIFCAGRFDSKLSVIHGWVDALAAAIPGTPPVTVPPPIVEPPPVVPPPIVDPPRPPTTAQPRPPSTPPPIRSGGSRWIAVLTALPVAIAALLKLFKRK